MADPLKNVSVQRAIETTIQYYDTNSTTENNLTTVEVIFLLNEISALR